MSDAAALDVNGRRIWLSPTAVFGAVGALLDGTDGGLAQRLGSVLLQQRVEGIDLGERLEHPAHGEPQVRDARLVVHPGRVRGDAVEGVHRGPHPG
jgi:hypothetical protein